MFVHYHNHDRLRPVHDDDDDDQMNLLNDDELVLV
jgi:hypothetical protein